MDKARLAGNESHSVPWAPLLRSRGTVRLVLLLLAVSPLTGCGSWFAPPPIAPYSVLELKQYALEELPVGDYLGAPLDDGRLRVAKPEDWFPGPRGDRLAEFCRDQKRQVLLPRIWVEVEPSPYEGISTVDASNVEQFAERVAQRLKREGTELHEPAIRPVQLGPTFGARYVYLTRFVPSSRSSQKPQLAERQVVEVLVDDRLYRVELHVPPGKMLEYRDMGYAVVASMEFPRAQEASPASGETESPGGDAGSPSETADSDAGSQGAVAAEGSGQE